MAKKKKTKPRKMIKDIIWDYMEEHGLSYVQMAKQLRLKHPQQLHRWLTNTNETYSSEVERKFNELVALDELS